MVLIDWVLGFVSDMTKMVSFPATSRGKSDFIRIEGVNQKTAHPPLESAHEQFLDCARVPPIGPG